MNPEHTLEGKPTQPTNNREPLDPNVAATKFDIPPVSTEQVDRFVSDLNTKLIDLLTSYEELRGKTDEVSIAAKQFIVSQSNILIEELGRNGVNSSGIVTDEMLQTPSSPEVPFEVGTMQNTSEITASSIQQKEQENTFSHLKNFFSKKNPVTFTSVPNTREYNTNPLLKELIPEEKKPENWLPYKTPINTSLFEDSPLFKKIMLELPSDRGDVPISGEQAYRLATPAVAEIARLQKDSSLQPRERMNAIAQLQRYLAKLQSDPVNQQFVARARNTFLNNPTKI